MADVVDKTTDPETLFDLKEQVGSGSYGSVHRAVGKAGGTYASKVAAVKMIKMEEGESIEDELNEIALLKKCNQENITGFFGAYLKNKDTIWICMEYCGGGSISDIYTKMGQPPSEQCICAVTYFSFVGLWYLHKEVKIMHRDIKGGNNLLTDNGGVKLADLGVSAQLSSTLQKRKSFIGTPYWIAPEIISAEMKVGPDSYSSKCDVWSMGITAIEIAEMQPPLFDLHPMRALYLIPKSPAPSLKDKKKWSKDFQKFLKDCLVKKPEKRPEANKVQDFSWFKAIKGKKKDGAPGKEALRVLIQSYKERYADAPKGEDADVGTITRQESSGDLEPGMAARVSAVADPGSSKLDVEEVEEESLYAVPKEMEGWGQQYVKVGGGRPGGPGGEGYIRRNEGPTGAGAGANKGVALYKPQDQGAGTKMDEEDMAAAKSSFVLSNVFAGCPLKVICAASWKFTVNGEEKLNIIVGASSGLYVLETTGDKRELVQVSKRQCTWLYVMNEENVMISVSEKGKGMGGLVCIHDLSSLIQTGDSPKFKTTKLYENCLGNKCAVVRDPKNNVYLCAVVPKHLILWQWYQPRKKFMKLKDFETPFTTAPPMFDMLVVEDKQDIGRLPVICVGATRDKSTRAKKLSIVDPNITQEKMSRHMSAELGWVRVRQGREDIYASSCVQVGPNRFCLCYSNMAQFLDGEGNDYKVGNEPHKIIFEAAPETFVYTADAVIGFSPKRMERRSTRTGRITHQMKDKGESFKVVGKDGNIIIETRASPEAPSHLYLLIRK
jgi:serine/threonine protein kinase